MPRNPNAAPVLRYPLTAYTEMTDYLQIDIVKYTPVQKKGGGSIASRAESRSINQQGKNRLSTILLPMPGNVSDNVSVKYGRSELNSIAGAAVGGIGDIMKSGEALANPENFLDELRKSVEDTARSMGTAAGGIEGVKGFVTRKLASSAAGIIGVNITPAQILARATGEVINPNIEMLFEGPTVRSFKFQFKMTPRNPNESAQIKQIIQTFKLHSAAKLGSGSSEIGNVTGGNTFVRTPDIFELRYRQGAGDHRFLHKFKQCFLDSVDVNYTGSGAYATYDDGTPVSMIMDLSFKEIEPIYDVDQANAQDEGKVGY